MKLYLLSLGAGVLVGVFYSLINVRSPAPPLVALIGLLGILMGERAVPLGKQIFTDTHSVPTHSQSHDAQPYSKPRTDQKTAEQKNDQTTSSHSGHS